MVVKWSQRFWVYDGNNLVSTCSSFYLFKCDVRTKNANWTLFFRRLSQQILQHGTLRAFCKVEVEFINWVFPLSKPKKPAYHEDIFFAYGLLNSDSLEGSCRLNTHSPTFQFPHPDARTWVRARCSSVQCVQGAKMTSQEFPFHDRTFSNPDTWTERF